MKHALMMIFLGVSLMALSGNGPKPVFEKKALEFKDVPEGQILEFSYTFKNEGDADFVMTHVHPTCGCTTPEWPKGPIKPGQTAQIKVKFDSTGRIGYNAKGINIESNAGEINLVFEVYVVKAK